MHTMRQENTESARLSQLKFAMEEPWHINGPHILIIPIQLGLY